MLFGSAALAMRPQCHGAGSVLRVHLQLAFGKSRWQMRNEAWNGRTERREETMKVPEAYGFHQAQDVLTAKILTT
jgi:hypothetical protein